MRRIICLLALCAVLLSGCSEPPAKPTGLKVTASGGKVEVSWDKNNTAHTYRLYRRYKGEKDYKFIFDSDKTFYTDKFVQAGREYTYKLELIGEGGVSEAVESSVTTQSAADNSAKATPLKAPRITSVTQLDESTAVIILSKKPKSSYEIYRSASENGKYTLVGSTEQSVFYDEKAKQGSPWHYKAKAVNKNKTSKFSKPARTGKNTKSVFGVPVMMYHEFVTAEDLKAGIAFDEYAVYQSEFESDLRWLKQNGYHTITASELSDYLDGKGKMPKKPIILSIDDGKYGVYKRAFPVLKKHNMKAVLNIIGSQIDLASVAPNYMKGNAAPYCNWDEIKEMSDSGYVEIQSHTQFLHVFNHDGRNGANCKDGETSEEYLTIAQKDFAEISRNMRSHLNTIPCAMAYPYSKRCVEADKAWLNSGYTLLFAGDREDVRMSEINYFVREAGLNYKSSILRRITRMTGTPIKDYI